MKYTTKHLLKLKKIIGSLEKFCLILVLLYATVSVEADEGQRWSEVGYGISLAPPPGTLQIETKAVTWVDSRGFSVSFEIARTDIPVNLFDLSGAALVQLGFAQSKPLLLDADGKPIDQFPLPTTIADRPAIKIYFELDANERVDWFKAPEVKGNLAENKGKWFCGQAIIMLEPFAAVVIKLNATSKAQVLGRAAFEEVLASVRVPLASELDELREERVERGDRWLKSTTPIQWAATLPREQWFRLVRQDREIGHVRIRLSREVSELSRYKHRPPGTLMVIDRREYLETHILDQRSIIFASDDGADELWETKKTLRPRIDSNKKSGRLQRQNPQEVFTWAETGIRGTQKVKRRGVDGNQIVRNANIMTVITESPPSSEVTRRIKAHEGFGGKVAVNDLRGRTQTNEWVAPTRSYLSQLQVWLLASMIPAESAIYCFTAYHPESGAPGLRTVEVVVQPDGALIVYDRPNSKITPIRYFFDAERNLVERISPQGNRMIPTTPKQLADIWNITLD
ncbi:MAG: hypothetical protein AAGH99_02070 [Planctomycetota bacterium]